SSARGDGAMSIRTIGVITACLGFCVSSAFAQEQNGEVSTVEDWAVTVIDLDYANAEEVAALLAEIVPPGVSVVPYYQTNSLIISGERALVEELTRGGEDGEAEDRGAGEASDRSPPLPEGEITARR